MAIIQDEFQSTLTSRQNDGYCLQYYTRLFKMSTEILESHLGGPLILENDVKTMEIYDNNDPSKKTTMVKQASESLFAYLYLENSDHEKYR